MRAHPTALVDPAARIAEDVEIGPFCIVGPRVNLGPGCRLGPRVSLMGSVEIGAGNVLHAQVSMGSGAGESSGRILIGEDNIFRECVSLAAPQRPDTVTRIGSRNLFNVWCTLEEGCDVADRVVIHPFCMLGRRVVLESGVRIGGQTFMAPGSRIGRDARVLHQSPVDGMAPPFARMDGNPAKVAGVAAAARTAELDAAFRALWLSDAPFEESLNNLKEHTADLKSLRDFLTRSPDPVEREGGLE